MAKGLCSLPLIPTPSAANRYVPCSVASEHFALEAFSSSAYPVPIARTPASPTTSSTTPAAQRLLRFMVVLLSSTLLVVGRLPAAGARAPLSDWCWPSSSPFAKGRGDQPRLKLINAPTLALGDEFLMNSWPTSENP